MYIDLRILSETLMKHGYIKEANEVDTLLAHAANISKLLSEYGPDEGADKARRSGEGRQSMSDETRNDIENIINLIFKHFNKNYSTISGYDFSPKGFHANQIVYIAHLLKQNPVFSETVKKIKHNSQIITAAIGSIIMKIVKDWVSEEPEISNQEILLKLKERGFFYKSTTSIRFIKMSPDYKNIIDAENKSEEDIEIVCLQIARDIKNLNPGKVVKALDIINVFKRKYPHNPLDPANAIRAASVFEAESSNDYNLIIVELIMKELTSPTGKGTLTASDIEKIFDKKYPNSTLKNKKTVFMAALSDLKKHLKIYIANVIMKLYKDGLSDTLIADYLSKALNYDITQVNVSIIRRKLEAGPLLKVPPSIDLPKSINFDDRRSMDDEQTKRNMFIEYLEKSLLNGFNGFLKGKGPSPGVGDRIKKWLIEQASRFDVDAAEAEAIVFDFGPKIDELFPEVSTNKPENVE